MFNDRVEITLYSVLGAKVLKNDPIGYRESEFNLARSEKTFGIFIKQINNLEFIEEAKGYLENLYSLYGVHAKCRLIRKEQHPTTDDWQLHSEGFLDFSTRKIKDGKLQINFVEGGLREVLTSQLREKFELNRTTDIEGNQISSIQRDEIELKGRDIYLLSRFNERGNEFTTYSGRWKSINEDRTAFHPLPLSITGNSDPENIFTPFDTYGSEERYTQSITNCFFKIANRPFGVVKVQGKIRFKVGSIDGNRVNAYNQKLIIRRFTSDVDGNNFTAVLADDIVIADLGDPNTGDEFNITIPETELQPQLYDSYAIGLYIVGQYGGPVIPPTFDGWKNTTFIEYSSYFNWAEDSFFEATVSPCLTLYDSLNRLTEIYTGNVNSFESYLLDGRDSTLLTDSLHNLVLLPGGWIRNLKKKDDDGNLKEWPMELSFEDAYKSIHAVLPVGYGISIQGNKQNIVLEDLRFFFQRTVVGHLGKLKIVERSTASDFCYQSLKFGYLKGGEYEEPLGLDEYNTQMNSKTPLTIVDNEYEALGPSRTDPYGVEYTRRYQFDQFPDEDRNEDKDNFLIDVKDTQNQRSNKLFTVRTWQDDFEEIPTGTYAPETGFNYNLSPARNRQRHSWWFNNGIVKLQDKDIQFVNAKGNSELKTKKVGEDYLKENADVPISKLDNPLFEPEWIDAEKHFDQQLLEKIIDTTLINGRRVNNYYGLWEFTNEQNRSEYAYIFTVKTKDKMTFKLLKAYGV